MIFERIHFYMLIYLSIVYFKVGNSTRRNERLYKLPICKRDCDSWFNDCRSSYTCASNWNRGFSWTNKVNYCLPHEKCQTIESKFKDSRSFCTQIWDESFQVLDDDGDEKNCFRFDLSLDRKDRKDHNKKVAAYYDQQMNASRRNMPKMWIFLIFILKHFY